MPLETYLLSIMAAIEVKQQKDFDTALDGLGQLKKYLTDCMEQFIQGLSQEMVRVMCDGFIDNWMYKIKEESDNKRIIANRLLETIEREKFREDEESTKQSPIELNEEVVEA